MVYYFNYKWFFFLGIEPFYPGILSSIGYFYFIQIGITMPIEIERKFLVDTIPSHQISRSKIVKQGYMVNDDRQVVRVRSMDMIIFLR